MGGVRNSGSMTVLARDRINTVHMPKAMPISGTPLEMRRPQRHHVNSVVPMTNMAIAPDAGKHQCSVSRLARITAIMPARRQRPHSMAATGVRVGRISRGWRLSAGSVSEKTALTNHSENGS